MQIRFSSIINNKRLDNFLSSLFFDISRNYIQLLIKEGKVLINNQKVKSSYKIKIKDEINIIGDLDFQVSNIKPKNINLDVVLNEKDFIIINKPSGIQVHPDSKYTQKDSVVNALLYHFPNDFNIKNSIRPGIVHRLDKNTSGLLIIAKNDMATNYFMNLFKNRKIKKYYYAIVSPQIEKSGEIKSYIGRKKNNTLEMTIKNPLNAKLAITKFKVLENKNNFSLLDIELITGRTHQIRVHFASINHPIVGDDVYGNKNLNKKLNIHKQLLQSYRLVFVWKDGKKYDVKIDQNLQSKF